MRRDHRAVGDVDEVSVGIGERSRTVPEAADSFEHCSLTAEVRADDDRLAFDGHRYAEVARAPVFRRRWLVQRQQFRDLQPMPRRLPFEYISGATSSILGSAAAEGRAD